MSLKSCLKSAENQEESNEKKVVTFNLEFNHDLEKNIKIMVTDMPKKRGRGRPPKSIDPDVKIENDLEARDQNKPPRIHY